MRLIGMRFKGIGPYEDGFSIDFAALSRSRMYLIEGETGAGKTTILDCITYALYAGTSAEGTDRTRLRSRFLGLRNERSYVDLIFELDGRYYRVRREPEYRYAKRNGDGTSTHAAKANLWRIDPRIAALTGQPEPDGDADRYFSFAEQAGNGTPLATKAGDVGTEIGQLIGLTREQFSKTIMLAQGRFSEFLRMKPDERTSLVEELFSAREYRDIQHILDDMRKTHGHDMETLRNRLADRIRQARDNAGRIADATAGQPNPASDAGADTQPAADDMTAADTIDNPRLWGLDESGGIAEPAYTSDTIIERLADASARVEAWTALAMRDASRAAEAGKAGAEEQERRHDLCRRLMEHADAERRLVTERLELDARRSGIEENRRRLDRSAQAEPVLARHRELEQRIREHAAAQEGLRDVRARLAELPARAELDERHRAALQAAGTEDSARRKLELAESHQTLLDKERKAARRLDEARQAHAVSLDTLERRRRELDDLPDADTVDKRIERLTERLAGRELLETRLDQARKRHDHARKAEELEELVATQQHAADAARTLADAARTAYEEANRSLSMLGAAQYADDLKDGQPCPVCGSTNHPNPYRPPKDAPGAQDVETLRDAARQRDNDLNDAERKLAALRAQLESERNQAQNQNTDQTQQLIDQAQTALDGLDDIAEQRQDAQRQRQSIRQAHEAYNTAQQRHTAAETELEHARQAHDAATSDADGLTQETVDRERADAERQLDTAREQAADAERIATAIRQREQLETQQAEHASRVDTLAAQVKDLEHTTDRLLKEHGFTDIDQALACTLDPEDAQRLQKENDAYHQQTTIAATRLEDTRRKLAGIIATERADTTDTADTTGTTPVAYNNDGTPTPLGERITAIDTDTLDHDLQQAKHLQDTTRTQLSHITELDNERRRYADDLAATARAWNQAVHDHEPIRTMAQLANASKDSPSERKLTLITYAVTERFRDVLTRANEILKDIQGGIYELRLGEHEGRAGTKTGLPIDILDRRNDQTRPPSSLSGGETFFISLALALALADVIQAENGGVSMDTLFIDEGFGTLSDDYLDDVMAVLRGISKTRDIGIISHVGQLKDQIAERISVRRDGREGASRLTVVV